MIYKFRCEKCGTEVEVYYASSNPTSKQEYIFCTEPKCGSKMKKVCTEVK